MRKGRGGFEQGCCLRLNDVARGARPLGGVECKQMLCAGEPLQELLATPATPGNAIRRATKCSAWWQDNRCSSAFFVSAGACKPNAVRAVSLPGSAKLSWRCGGRLEKKKQDGASDALPGTCPSRIPEERAALQREGFSAFTLKSTRGLGRGGGEGKFQSHKPLNYCLVRRVKQLNNLAALRYVMLACLVRPANSLWGVSQDASALPPHCRKILCFVGDELCIVAVTCMFAVE